MYKGQAILVPCEILIRPLSLTCSVALTSCGICFTLWLRRFIFTRVVIFSIAARPAFSALVNKLIFSLKSVFHISFLAGLATLLWELHFDWLVVHHLNLFQTESTSWIALQFSSDIHGPHEMSHTEPSHPVALKQVDIFGCKWNISTSILWLYSPATSRSKFSQMGHSRFSQFVNLSNTSSLWISTVYAKHQCQLYLVICANQQMLAGLHSWLWCEHGKHYTCSASACCFVIVNTLARWLQHFGQSSRTELLGWRHMFTSIKKFLSDLKTFKLAIIQLHGQHVKPPLNQDFPVVS